MNKEINKLRESLQIVVRSKAFKVGIYAFGILLTASLIFQAGVIAGLHKGSYGRDWRDNYSRNFGPMRQSKMFGGMPEDFPNAHGAIGKIVKIDLPTLIVEDKDGTEKVITLTNSTEIRRLRETKTQNELKLDDTIVVIGAPNAKGQIEAKLVRILPVLPDALDDQQIQSPNN